MAKKEKPKMNEIRRKIDLCLALFLTIGSSITGVLLIMANAYLVSIPFFLSTIIGVHSFRYFRSLKHRRKMFENKEINRQTT